MSSPKSGMGAAYTCRICATKSKSLKELTAHYQKDHPEMIEDLMMPI